ncbi:zwei Ig domain protein zig-8-like isoform X1 [Neocloeon triangulifer]|uniref:zwei Ig domain protein zig-8-like isoform X1 n=1 Tax=Neocloeon triangulifer TaxID=2078957 RepID=UPI00286EF81B|nr:zwei Ig domain protein zig-8-like isoform X1 [Neocloeon triangulifer]
MSPSSLHVTMDVAPHSSNSKMLFVAGLLGLLIVLCQPAKGLLQPENSIEYTVEELNHGNDSSYPYFDFNVPRNVTTAVGQTAFLHCRVEQLGDKAVSWIRKRDLHILTAGIYTYTSDARFQVMRPERSENWTLQVKFPQQRDAGIYECQVNTEPKLSLAFRLNVIEAKARILGPADLYVKTGSTISLSCLISQGPHDLGTVFWYHGATIVDYDSPRGGVKIETEWTDALTSRLRITNARITDSGNYTCIPTIAAPASVMVHVINGEHPAAMQHGNKNHSNGLLNNLSLLLVHSFTVFLIKWLR